MPGVVDRLATAETAAVVADDRAVLADHNALGVSLDLDRSADSPRGDRVLVVVEAHEAGLRDRCLDCMEPVKRAADGHEARTLRLEGLPDRAIRQLWVLVHLGIGDTSVEQPSVQLFVARHSQPRRKETLAHQTYLVLHLALLPARGRRASDRINQVVAAHPQKAAVVLTVLADEDAINCRLHVVVDAARAGPLEEGEGAVVGIEHHLLGLARIGAHEQHSAMTQPEVRHLDGDRCAVDQYDLVAPVELVGFARREAQRYVGFRRRRPAFDAPLLGVTPDRIVAALVAETPQLLEYPDQRQPFARRSRLIIRQHPVEIAVPCSQLRPRLHHPHVLKGRRSRSQNLPHRVPRHLQLTRDLLDRLALNTVLAPDPADRLHNQHPPSPARHPKRVSVPVIAKRGSKLDADHPSTGVNLPRRITSFGNMSQSVGLALATERIPFATAIAPIYAQSVDEFAQNGAYLNEVSGGRFQFASGTADAPAYLRMAVKPGKPLGDIRAFVEKFKSHTDYGPLPPVILATLRKRMIALSAEIAEGLVFANGSRAHMTESLGTLPAAKRGNPDFFIGNRIRTCISDDVDEAKAVLRKTMAHYWAMPNYRNYWKEAGYLDEMNAAEAAIAEGRTDELPTYLTDRWLADCTLYGPAARVREGVEQWREAGITTPVLVPLSPDGNQMNALKAVFAAFER